MLKEWDSMILTTSERDFLTTEWWVTILPDPLKVDLTVFHSVEIPKGSGENYTDGITPFVLAKVMQENGKVAYMMQSGYRERQTQSPLTGKTMRYEPRPGYQEEPKSGNMPTRSVAMSNDPRTWPDKWVDKMNDVTDPGWSGSWNGYFGKVPKLEMQEMPTLMIDKFTMHGNIIPTVATAQEEVSV
ncbi:hypothetical protein MASR1M107_24190 [Ignavibacteriales bacterium]